LPTPLLQLHNISCTKGYERLFAGLSCALSAGELLYVTGPNGSGKTTLLRVLAGLNRDYSGTLHFKGEDVRSSWPLYAPELLYMGHQPALKAQLTARENLLWYAHCCGATVAEVDAALNAVGLAHRADLPAHQLSAGQQRRVVLARLMFSQQAVWILDEPFTAIDAAGFAPVFACLQVHLQRGGLVVMTSHHGMDDIPLPHRSLCMADYDPQNYVPHNYVPHNYVPHNGAANDESAA
jgi:heme exporter protein A